MGSKINQLLQQWPPLGAIIHMNSTYRSMMYSAFFMQYLNQNSELSTPVQPFPVDHFCAQEPCTDGLLYRDLLYSESVR